MGIRMPEKGDNGEMPYGESDFRFENLAAKKVVEAAADEEGDKDFYG